jgi:hypothetical protein
VPGEAVVQGKGWYPEMNAWATTLASGHDVPTETVAGLAAIYSPRRRWEKVMDMVDLKLAGVKVPVMVREAAKVARVLDGEDPATVVSGQKVSSFYQNLLLNLTAVTIDTWAFSQVTGRDYETNFRRMLENKGQYAMYASCFRTVADEVGLEPAEFQSVLWHFARDFNKVPT